MRRSGRTDLPSRRTGALGCSWRRWSLLSALAAALPASSGAARADEPRLEASAPAEAAPLSLEVGAGYVARSDQQDSPLGTVATRGGVLSHAHLEAAFHPGGGALGAWLRAGAERFGLTERAAATPAVARTLTLLEGAAALAVRGGGAAFRWQGVAGYAYQSSPTFVLTETSADVRVIHDHGPLVGGRIDLEVARWLELEAHLRGVPQAFGASLDGQALVVRRLDAGAGLALGDLRAGGTRLQMVLEYDLGLATVRGGPVALTQLRHRLGIAVRVSYGARAPAAALQARAPAATAPPAPPPAPEPAPIDLTAAASSPPSAVPPAGGVTGALWGRTRTAGSGRLRRVPLANATVVWRAEGATRPAASVRSDRTGQFSLDNLLAGAGSLQIEAAGFQPFEKPLTIVAGQSPALDLTLDADGARDRARIRGNVATAGGRRVRAILLVPETGARVKPGRKGRFELELPPGSYTLEVRARGYVTQRKTVELTGGEESIFAIELHRARR